MKNTPNLLQEIVDAIFTDDNDKPVLISKTANIVIYGNKTMNVKFEVVHNGLESISIITEQEGIRKEKRYLLVGERIDKCQYIYTNKDDTYKLNGFYDFKTKYTSMKMEDKNERITRVFVGGFRKASIENSNGYNITVTSNGVTLNTFDPDLTKDLNNYSLKLNEAPSFPLKLNTAIKLSEIMDETMTRSNKTDTLKKIDDEIHTHDVSKIDTRYTIDYYTDALDQENKKSAVHIVKGIKKSQNIFYFGFNENLYQVFETEENGSISYLVYIINAIPVVAVQYDNNFNMEEMYYIHDRINSISKFTKKEVDINNITIDFEKMNLEDRVPLDINNIKIKGGKKYEANILNTLATTAFYKIINTNIYNSKDIINIYNSLNERLKNIHSKSDITENTKKGL